MHILIINNVSFKAGLFISSFLHSGYQTQYLENWKKFSGAENSLILPLFSPLCGKISSNSIWNACLMHMFRKEWIYSTAWTISSTGMFRRLVVPFQISRRKLNVLCISVSDPNCLYLHFCFSFTWLAWDICGGKPELPQGFFIGSLMADTSDNKELSVAHFSELILWLIHERRMRNW